MTFQEKGYNGNIHLKRGSTKVEWTPEMVDDYVKCSEDPVYFIEHHMRIIHVDHGLVPFKLYDYQKDMVRSMHEHRNTICITARQVGKSICTCGYILWYILFNSHKTVALLAQKGDVARLMLQKIQLAYQHLPKYIQMGVEVWNKGSILLSNQTEVIACSTTSDSIRGRAISLLFIDEFAFVPKYDEFAASTLPTITSGKTTKIILTTTPCGMNHAWRIWEEALQGRNDFNPIKVTWDQVPGRDQVWYEHTLGILGGDIEKFQQEYSVEFLGSSGTLIAGWKLKQLTSQIPVQQNDGLFQYEAPIKDHRYALIADVSHGKGLDYSAFHVIDVTEMPYKQVCVFHSNKITPTDYASIIYSIAKSYNDSLVLIELMDVGYEVASLVHFEHEYENMIMTASFERKTIAVSGFGRYNSADKGVRTNKNIKAIGCSIVKLLIEQNQLLINDQETIKELSTFSKKNTSYEAEEGCHDDLVMGLVLLGWLSTQDYFKEYVSIDTLKNLRDFSEEEIENDLLPFGFVMRGTDEQDENRMVVDVVDEFYKTWLN